MTNLIRTNSENKDFIDLVKQLDKELAVRDGDDHDFYNQFNKLDAIKHVVVAYVDDTPLACGAFKKFDKKSVEIKRMYTSPSARGKGLAKLTLSALENWAAELAFKRIVLETGKKQPEAIALYKNSDYTIMPENYGQYKGVANSVCFEKLI